jgi:hypothetical protein
VLRAKDSFDFFVLVHGNIPKLIVIQRGICFSYEYRFCLVDKCINYVFLKKIKCHKNRVGGTCSKYLLLLYSENNQFISFVSIDMNEYRKKYNSKSVKKTLSIPAWLDNLSEKNNLNFSQILQEALKDKLGID